MASGLEAENRGTCSTEKVNRMKIAVLYPQDNISCSWNMGPGICNTLERMGFECVRVPMPTIREPNRRQFDEAKRSCPPLSILKGCDGVITSGPEHIGPWVSEIYERYEWKALTDNLPTAAWLHESTEREDYQIDFDGIKWVAKDFFFPGIQDAEKHDQDMFAAGHSHYLPLGVDICMFRHPSHLGRTPKRGGYDVGFIGGLYPRRVAFLQALSRHNHPPVRIANISVQDIDGYNAMDSTERYAEGIRSIRVFFNLPAMSRMLVSKVFEVMACGGFLLTPQLPLEGGVGKNMLLFETGRHLVYYRASNLPFVAQLLRDWSSQEKDVERRAIAEEGFKEVIAKHTLEHRLTAMLTTMGVNITQAVQ
jgi:hypothetical protein